MKKRRYIGFIKAEKLYRGNKTINLVIKKEEGKKLSKLIEQASESCKKFDLKIVNKPRKDDTYTMTITYIEE